MGCYCSWCISDGLLLLVAVVVMGCSCYCRQELYADVVEYYGENARTLSPSTFFSLFVRFIKAFKVGVSVVDAHLSTHLVCWSIGQLVCWSVGLLVTWSLGLLVSWSVGQLVSWSVGQLVSCWFVRIAQQLTLVNV